MNHRRSTSTLEKSYNNQIVIADATPKLIIVGLLSVDVLIWGLVVFLAVSFA